MVKEGGTSALEGYIEARPEVDTFLSDTDREKLTEVLDEIFKGMKPRDARLLKLRYGLEDGDDYNFQGVGRKLKISPERARQVAVRAMRHMRRRANLSALAGFMEDEDNEAAKKAHHDIDGGWHRAYRSQNYQVRKVN